MKTKICNKCNQRKPTKDFHKRKPRKSRSKYGKPYRKNKNNSGKSDYQGICKDCWKIKCHQYYVAHKQQHQEKTRQWKLNHKPEMKNYQIETRLKVLDFLGNKCVRCGFSDKRAIQIDHIKGDGYKEKHSYRGQIYGILRLIKSSPHEVIKKYQLLCANCNWIKRDENHEHN